MLESSIAWRLAEGASPKHQVNLKVSRCRTKAAQQETPSSSRRKTHRWFEELRVLLMRAFVYLFFRGLGVLKETKQKDSTVAGCLTQLKVTLWYYQGESNGPFLLLCINKFPGVTTNRLASAHRGQFWQNGLITEKDTSQLADKISFPCLHTHQTAFWVKNLLTVSGFTGIIG